MSQRTRSVAQIVTAAAFLYSAAQLQASSPTAYVSLCCNAPSTAGVFNASTLAQTRSIATGSGGDGIALTPDGTKLFVTVDNKRELQAIDTSTGTILARVPVPINASGEPPLELAISPDGSRVYVFAPQDDPNAELLEVDTTTYLVTHSLNLPFNESVGPLMVSPDGSQLYFEMGLANEYIQVVDTATLALGAQIPVNEYPLWLTVTPSGLILMTDTDNELLVIDPQSGTIVNRFTLASRTAVLSGAIASSPDSTTAYIGFVGPSILAVNIKTGATVFEAPTSYNPSQFAISSNGESLYSIDYSITGAPSVSEFQIPAQKPVATVRQLGPLSGLALSHDGGTLYVLNADESALASVDVSSQKATGVTLGGVGINSLAIPPNGNTVWASSYEFAAGGDILVLNPATGQLKFTVGPTGALSFAPSGTVLYVANPAQVVALDVQSMTQVAKFSAAQLQNIGQAIPSPDGTRLYLSITFVSGGPRQPQGRAVLPPGDIAVLDTSTFKRVGTINIPDGLGGLALTSDGSTLVCTSNKGQVHLIDTATDKITATIDLTPANGLLESVAPSSDGATAYVADTENNLLFVASIATQAQLAKIAVGQDPFNVAITPDGSEAWVLTGAGLEIVNLATGQVGGPVALPGAPSAIVFAP
jgi:YVTN family beta-propeller protein